MNQSSQISFSSNETIWDVHLSAEGWKPDNQFNWIDVSGDNDEFGFSLLYEFSDMVQTELKVERSGLFDCFLYAINHKITFGLKLSFLGESFSLLLVIFRSILLQKLEQNLSLISLQGS